MSNKNYVNISSQALLSGPGPFNKGRKLFRHSILDFISTLNKKVDNKFLRGLYLHSVFDDQIEKFEELIISLMKLGNFVDTETLVRMLRGEKEIDAMEFMDLISDRIKLLNLKDSLLKRPVNEGFSGGEKKRNEIFQMAVLEPKLALLDETDSGLDIDALRVVANGVNSMRNDESATIIVTHYQRLLNYIIPDFVHILVDGRIISSGDKNLALDLEEKGYDKIVEDAKV